MGHHASLVIDYLSIDTEGSELEILRTLDFERWHFNVIYVTSNPASGFEMMMSRSLRTLMVKPEGLLIEGYLGIPPQRPNLIQFGTYRRSF